MAVTLPPGFLIRPPTKAEAEDIVELLTTDANTVDYLYYTVNDLLAHWQAPDFNKDTNAWVVQIEMDSRPPLPQWPKGISVRSFIPDQDEHLAHELIQEAFQISEPFEEWEQTFTQESFDPTLWCFALDGEHVAGAILCYNNNPEMGWIWDLAIRILWRRRGIGMALLQHAFNEFYRRGRRKIGLDVNAGNQTGAIQLYRHVGMQQVQEFYTYEKELSLET